MHGFIVTVEYVAGNEIVDKIVDQVVVKSHSCVQKIQVQERIEKIEKQRWYAIKGHDI